MHKDVESVLLSEKQLEKIVNSLAKKIEKDYNGKEFIMVGLLKGSVAFMADLMKKIDLDFSIDFMVASSFSRSSAEAFKSVSNLIISSVLVIFTPFPRIYVLQA